MDFYLIMYPVPLPFPTFWISPASIISFNYNFPNL